MKTKIYGVISTPVLAFFALLLFGATTITAAPGDLDPTFGTGGTVITVLLPDYDFAQNSAHEMAIQPDGKIVVSGYGDFYPGFPAFRSFLVRYNPNGSLDTDFGTNGTVIIPYQAPSFERFQNGLVILPDGKILVSGTTINRPNDRLGFAVFRYNSNGSRDTSFGINGVAVTSFGDDNLDTGHTLRVQPDGKIVVVGEIYSCDYLDCYDFGVGVARFSDDGRIDTAFGENGRLRILGPANEYYSASNLAVLSDGKLLLFGRIYNPGNNDSKVFLCRTNPNGRLDASFGTNGILLPEIDQLNYYVYQFALQPDGKIVFPTANLNGNNFGSSTIVRLNPDGSFDTSFGTNGKVVIPSAEGVFGYSVLIQPNGKILAAGQTSGAAPFRFAIVRLHADGSRDTTFGSNGIVTTLLDSYGNYVSDMALQPDGKLVACGRVHDSLVTDYDIGLARYILDSPTSTPTPTPTPTTTPTPTSVSSPTPTPIANGKIAFASNRDGNYEIYLMNSDGTGQVRLTNNPGYDGDPSFSPDGRRIAFVSGNADSYGIKVMNADGSNQISLTNNFAGDATPQWSPDGTKIVFTRQTHTGSPYEIFVMNADGGNLTRLTTISPAFDNYPSWSPDGSKIVFGCDYASICVMNADGSNRVTLTGSYVAEPRWSPDGKIAYSSLRCDLDCYDPIEIYVMNADGSGQQNLTQSPNVNERAPAWSPDSSKLVFSVYYGSNDVGAADIFTMNRDGSGRTQLTNAPGGSNNRSPSWQPLVPSACPNPVDCPEFFVRQHYLDFLAREPEQSGLDAWLRVLSNCPAGDDECLHQARLTTSAAFFGSPEFQLKGYFVFRFYKVAFGRLPTYSEIIPDMQSVSGSTPAEVYTHKATFTDAFVQRPEFFNTFSTQSNADYVTTLLGRYQLARITTPDPAAPDGAAKVTLRQADLVARLANNSLTRAQVLRAIADADEVFQLEFNRAFVAMQYYGYLRRTPEPGGYNAWLSYLNSHPQDYREMVRGFVDSTEYRRRFGRP